MRRMAGLVAVLAMVSVQALAEETSSGTHITIHDPANLSGKRAEQVYRAIQPALREAYLESGDLVGAAYQKWKRFNTVPYRSSVHGERFVNNFVNEIAAESYGRFEKISSMPAGSVVVKDSFAVTEKGAIKAGPLFLMEKKEKGWNPATLDWLFMAIKEDGAVLGATRGTNAGAVQFCASCHNQGTTQDSLYFLPEELRVKAPQ